MKKFLGVSFAAMLAVSPMMANAAPAVATGTSGTISAATAAENNADLTTVATTNYVKGAYNAIATEHNKIVADINVATNGTYIGAGKGVAANLVALDTAVKDNADHIGTMSSLNVEANDLVSAINAVNTAVTNLDTTAGNTYVTIDSAAATGINTYATGDGEHVGANLHALDAAIVAEETRATTAEGVLDGRLDTLEADVNTAGSVLKSIHDNAATAAYDNEESELTATTIQGAIDELKGAIDASGQTMTDDFATKVGVAATVNAATVTANGTVATLQTWGDNTPTNLPISTSGQVVVDGYHATATSNQSSGS